MQPSAREVLRSLVQSQVFITSPEVPIIGKNGIGRPAWIFDFRAVLLQPDFLDAYADFFWDTHTDLPPFQVCGIETAGIALVAAIVMKGHSRGKKVNGLYVRKSRKKDGLLKVIEGTPTSEPVVVVDDILNSGQSMHRALTILTDAQLPILEVFAILSLQSPSLLALNPDTVVREIFVRNEFAIPPPPPRPLLAHYTLLWRFRAPHPSLHHVVPKSAPTIDGDTVYMGSDHGTMYALDQHTGNVKWEHHVHVAPFGKGIFSSPLIYKNTLYFGAYDGNFYALDTASGRPNWIYRDADWIGSSPTVAPDLGLIFVGLEFGLIRRRGGLAALDAATGRERWVVRDIADFVHSSPLYCAHHQLVIVGNNDGTVYAFDAKRGSKRWSYKTGGSVKASYAYDAVNNIVICGSFDGFVYALDATTGTLQWKFDAHEGIYSTPLIHASTVFVTCLNKKVYALSLTGEKLWEMSTRGRIFCSPTVADDSLWVGSNDGCLYELNPENGAPRGYLQLSERIVNAPVFNAATSRFFVPTQANELYCISRA